MERAGHDGRIQPLALQILSAREIPIHVHRVWRPPLSNDRDDPGLLLRVDEHQRFASQAVKVLFENAAREERRHAGIESIPALQQNAEGHGGRKGMAGRHSAGRPHDSGSQRCPSRLAILHRHLRVRDVRENRHNGCRDHDTCTPSRVHGTTSLCDIVSIGDDRLPAVEYGAHRSRPLDVNGMAILQVTGIDIVDKALQRGRDRVQKAGVDMRLVHGDVTALRAAGIGSGFRPVLGQHK